MELIGDDNQKIKITGDDIIHSIQNHTIPRCSKEEAIANLSAYKDERNYIKQIGNVTASVFATFLFLSIIFDYDPNSSNYSNIHAESCQASGQHYAAWEYVDSMSNNSAVTINISELGQSKELQEIEDFLEEKSRYKRQMVLLKKGIDYRVRTSRRENEIPSSKGWKKMVSLISDKLVSIGEQNRKLAKRHCEKGRKPNYRIANNQQDR